MEEVAVIVQVYLVLSLAHHLEKYVDHVYPVQAEVFLVRDIVQISQEHFHV